MNRTELERRAARWRLHHEVRCALLAAAAGVLVASAVIRLTPGAALIVAATVGGVVWSGLRRRGRSVEADTIAAHLNRVCPTLEESAALWLRDPQSLTLVERLQLKRLDAAWAALANREAAGWPSMRRLRAPGAALAGALAVFVLALRWQHAATAPRAEEGAPVASRAATPKAKPATLVSAAISIAPPAYLERPARRIASLDGEVEEGAVVTWDLTFDGEVQGVAIERSDSVGSVEFEKLGPRAFRASTVITDTLIYQVRSGDTEAARTVEPQVHTLKVIRDQPPRLAWVQPSAPRTLVESANATNVTVSIVATDDHDLAGVHLVATVAKGAGEGVKFREQRFTLERGDDGATFGRGLDLVALGLEPGDEIYFYAEAEDRRTPKPNRARSETRFVVLRGPDAARADAGLAVKGVNLLPQYFRSQRQLIIDTERLLAERAQLAEETFRERAEEIGIDQKLLRLRYGQFLGEELEPEASGAAKEAQAMGFAARLQGRSRESAERAAAVERAVELQHQHEPPASRDGRPATIEEIRAPFVHNHDNAEVATTFDPQVKASLRAVLAAMWDAEGYLRTGRPAEALPSEHRALELLKELQQADRVYVQRVGFEPAPLKIAERRLRGELDAIPREGRSAVPVPEGGAEVAAVQAVLSALGADALGELDQAIAARVDASLTAAARARPEVFVRALEIWRNRGRALDETQRVSLRRALWELLPARQETPRRLPESIPSLAKRYFDALERRGESER